MLKVGLGRSLLFLEGCWVGPLLTPQPGGMAVQEEEGEECSKGLSAPRSTHRRGQPALPAVASERPSGELGGPFPIAPRGSWPGLGEAVGPAPY